MVKDFNLRIIIVVLTAVLLSTLTCDAQRRNSKGYKMVRKITYQVFNSKGEEWTNFARDLFYIYDDKDALVGIDDIEHHEDGDWTIRYRKEVKRIIGRKYHNGRLYPHDSVEIRHNGRVEYNTAYGRNNELLFSQLYKISVYNRGNAMAIVKDQYYDETHNKPGDTAMIKSFVNDDIDNLAKSRFSNDYGFNLNPFSGSMRYLFTKEGRIYSRDPTRPTNIDIVYFVDGDLQYNVRESRDDIITDKYRRDVMEANEYTDIINDTNVEFLALDGRPTGNGSICRSLPVNGCL